VVPPTVRAALLVTAASAVGAGLVRRFPESPPTATAVAHPPPARDEQASPCPPHTVEDRGVCVPVGQSSPLPGGPSLIPSPGAHREPDGQWLEYEQIPRLPERPSDYALYRYPIEPLASGFIGSGYDLDRPDPLQRRGAGLSQVGHGGLDLAQRRGAAVRLVELTHQLEPATLVHAGQLFGNTVVTRHLLQEGGASKEYLVVYGHLESISEELTPGLPLPEGTLLGTVGDSGSPGIVHLHLEVRQLRRTTVLDDLQPHQLVNNGHTVACDPRNVFPLLEPDGSPGTR